MTKEERILRFKYPDRTEFTDEELKEARRILLYDDEKGDDASRLPTRFVPIGASCNYNGKFYRCIEVPRNLQSDPCSGCDIRSENCNSKTPQCSPFDRRDHKRVWFKLLDYITL